MPANRTKRVNSKKMKIGPTEARIRALSEMEGGHMRAEDLFRIVEAMPVKGKHLRPRGAPSVHIPNAAERKAMRFLGPRQNKGGQRPVSNRRIGKRSR